MLASSLILTAFKIFFRGELIADTLIEAALLFLASFLAWALARELDPDRVTRAYLAQGLVIPVWLFIGPIPILPSSIVLLSSRYLSRISGKGWTLWDRLLLLISAIGIMLFFQNPVFGFFGGLIFAVDGCLDKNFKNNILLSATAITLSFTYTLFVWHPKPLYSSSAELLFLGVIGAISLVRIRRLRTVKSLTDQNELPVQPKRLRAAILLAVLLPLISIGFLTGDFNQFTLLLITLVTSAL